MLLLRQLILLPAPKECKFLHHPGVSVLYCGIYTLDGFNGGAVATQEHQEIWTTINGQQAEPGLYFACKEPGGSFFMCSITKCMVVESNALMYNWALSFRSVLSTTWRRRGESKVYFSEITVFFTVEPSLHLITEKLCTRPAHADWLSLMGINRQVWQPWSFAHFNTWQCKRVSNTMGCFVRFVHPVTMVD